MSPPLARIILDTNVGEPWLEAIAEFESKLTTAKARARVKAARDLGDVLEGLRIVVSDPSHLQFNLNLPLNSMESLGCHQTPRVFHRVIPTHED